MFRKKITKQEAIENHIEKYVGPIYKVFHELISPDFHLDVYWIETEIYTEKVYVLVTCGMSDLPMNVPESLDQFRFAELCMILPGNWNFENLNDENNFWPIKVLKDLSRYPHHYNTWLGIEHTTAEEGNQTYSPNVGFCGSLLFVPLGIDENFYQLKHDKKIINFYSIIPLYPEEIEFKLNNGISALLELFERHMISDIVDINRLNTCM